jgi:hypothetical protein
MRPRHELILAFSAVALLGLGAGLLGRSRNTVTRRDERATTFNTTPGGLSALHAALGRLGIPVRRYRERTIQLPGLVDSAGGAAPQLLIVAAPGAPFSSPERTALLRFGEHADLLLAGKAAESLMRCFGYRVERRILDSARVNPAAGPAWARPAWSSSWLVPTGMRVVEDSSRSADVERTQTVCRVPDVARVDTLLLTERGRPVALILERAGAGGRVLLVAEEGLLRNRTLRSSDAGPFMLRLASEGYRRVIFEEYHHGHGASGSLAGAVLGWSKVSPWGWMVWQAAVVGLIALLAAAVRFGPPGPGLPRRRRSPIEHVRALATALGAAQGHDTAIAAMVRGLRRRLAPPALRTRGDWRQWLQGLDQRPLRPRGREALAQLQALTRPGQPPSSVLLAANAVEDLWEDLRP